MKPLFVLIAWAVKFRAFGFTFGSYSDHKVVALPAIFQVASALTNAHMAYSYNDHGVIVSVSLTDDPTAAVTV